MYVGHAAPSWSSLHSRHNCEGLLTGYGVVSRTERAGTQPMPDDHPFSDGRRIAFLLPVSQPTAKRVVTIIADSAMSTLRIPFSFCFGKIPILQTTYCLRQQNRPFPTSPSESIFNQNIILFSSFVPGVGISLLDPIVIGSALWKPPVSKRSGIRTYFLPGKLPFPDPFPVRLSTTIINTAAIAVFIIVPGVGIEPTCLATHPLKGCAYTISPPRQTLVASN